MQISGAQNGAILTILARAAADKLGAATSFVQAALPSGTVVPTAEAVQDVGPVGYPGADGQALVKPVFDQEWWNNATGEERRAFGRAHAAYEAATSTGLRKELALSMLNAYDEQERMERDGGFNRQVTLSLRRDFRAAESAVVGERGFMARELAVEAASQALNGIWGYAHDANTRTAILAARTEPFVPPPPANEAEARAWALMEAQEEDGVRYIMMNATVQQAFLRSSFNAPDVFERREDGTIALRETTITHSKYGDLARIDADGNITVFA